MVWISVRRFRVGCCVRAGRDHRASGRWNPSIDGLGRVERLQQLVFELLAFLRQLVSSPLDSSDLSPQGMTFPRSVRLLDRESVRHDASGLDHCTWAAWHLAIALLSISPRPCDSGPTQPFAFVDGIAGMPPRFASCPDGGDDELLGLANSHSWRRSGGAIRETGRAGPFGLTDRSGRLLCLSQRPYDGLVTSSGPSSCPIYGPAKTRFSSKDHWHPILGSIPSTPGF